MSLDDEVSFSLVTLLVSPSLFKGTPPNFDNGIVLGAAFIQAFSTGIPMFMVISFRPRFLVTFEKAVLIAT
jgi:hypothetical protein